MKQVHMFPTMYESIRENKTKQDLVFHHEKNVKEAPAFSSVNNFSETDAQVGSQEDWDFSARATARLRCVLSCSQVSP